MRTLSMITLLLCALAVSASITVRQGGLGKKGKCDDDPTGCAEPLSCVGNPGNMRCFEKRKLGEKCGKDPFWVCEDGLVCNKKICAEPGTKGVSCNLPTDMCIAPLECVGNEGNKRCFEKRDEGEKCGKDPFWVCKDDLVCNKKICAVPGTMGVSCNLPTDECIPPLSCVGNEGNKRCFEKRKLGEKCGKDPFWVCEDDLVCNKKKCMEPGTKGVSCNLPTDKCIAPLECVGNEGNKRCFEKRKLGEKCGKDPFWVCVDGLICNEDNKCMDPMKTKGESCNLPTDICEEPLSCVGNEKNKRCFEKRKLGEKCGKDPFWVCVDGLVCSKKKCMEPGTKGVSCNLPTDECIAPLECVGNEGNKRCFEKRDIGGKCGMDPFWQCKDGLICVRNICEAA